MFFNEVTPLMSLGQSVYNQQNSQSDLPPPAKKIKTKIYSVGVNHIPTPPPQPPLQLASPLFNNSLSIQAFDQNHFISCCMRGDLEGIKTELRDHGNEQKKLLEGLYFSTVFKQKFAAIHFVDEQEVDQKLDGFRAIKAGLSSNWNKETEEIVCYLISRTQIVSNDDRLVVFNLAVRNGYSLALQEFFINCGFKIHESDNLVLRTAATFGRVNQVKDLLKNPNVDPGALDNEALRYASANGHLEVVDMLLRWKRHNLKLDPQVNGNEALLSAIKGKHAQVALRLIQDDRVQPIAQSFAMAKRLVKRGLISVMEALLKSEKIDPAISHERITNFPIQYAMRLGNIPMVNVLLSHKKVNPFADKKNGYYNLERYLNIQVEGTINSLLKDPYARIYREENKKHFRHVIKHLIRHNQTNHLTTCLSEPRIFNTFDFDKWLRFAEQISKGYGNIPQDDPNKGVLFAEGNVGALLEMYQKRKTPEIKTQEDSFPADLIQSWLNDSAEIENKFPTE